MKNEFCIVLTTTNDEQNKQQLINALLSKQLAACVQTMAIESHYVWKEALCKDNEILLIIKTKKSLYPELENVINQTHSYEVPQIIQVPIIDGFNPYLAWIEANTH